MGRRRLLLLLTAICLVAFVGGCKRAGSGPERDDAESHDFYGFIDFHPPSQPSVPTPTIAYVPLDQAPVRGTSSEDTLVTVVEFSDFHRPFCARTSLMIDKVMKEQGADTRHAFRHYPMSSRDAAAAAAFMADREEFWEYRAHLFENQSALQIPDLERYAEQFGEKVDDFVHAIDEYREQVAADVRLGARVGVRRAPAFFVNGMLLTGATESSLGALVEEQRTLARRLRDETGKTGDELYRALVEANRENAR